ncbi:MAG: head decoration protein [Candidatus Parabeggiatoa sp. nov. 3]|nr:MAG: head decoration protein [Gammaproteobacteria bacterium]RKZ64550.1 MAG: head decoration protein [Gammaproteobacteria bacterium]RKZ75775.1 MAG: head decoration protein [Gammaproteobacteria bacterium]
MSYAPVTEPGKWGDAIKHEYDTSFTRERITIASGQNAVLKQLTLLGQITATNKYTPLNPAASDGSETAKAILYTNVDATSADQEAIVLKRGPAIIHFEQLVLVNELDANAIVNAKLSLLNENIISREGG